MKDDVTSRLQISRKLRLYLLTTTAFFVTLDVFISNGQPVVVAQIQCWEVGTMCVHQVYSSSMVREVYFFV